MRSRLTNEVTKLFIASDFRVTGLEGKKLLVKPIQEVGTKIKDRGQADIELR